MWKKLKKGPKSNIETPKNVPGRSLTPLRPSLGLSLEFLYCFFDQKTGISHVGKHEMCHKIGQFSSPEWPVNTVSAVPQTNRRSLYNGTLFLTTFSAVSSKSGARGRGYQK